MNLSFIAPFFLAGLAAIAIPVLIHLTHRERREPVLFPSLMFLRKVPFRTVRRQRIRNWFLFLLRTIAVILLVAAFSRPLWDTAHLGTTVLGSARELVILLDHSYSMSYRDRWESALTAARDVVAELDPGDRATTVLFSDRAEVANAPTADPAVLRGVLDATELGGGRTRFGPALRLAHDILEASELPRREVMLISDFQRIGWSAADGVRLPAGAEFRPVDLSDAGAANLGVADVVIDRTKAGGVDRVRTTARIVNTGATAIVGAHVALEIDGAIAATQSVDVPAHGASVVTFTTRAVSERVVRGRVVLDADDLVADDAYHFVLRPVQSVPVLVLTHPAAAPEEMLYVQRALGIGDHPPFDARIKIVSELWSEDLDNAAVVFLADAPFPTGSSGRRLIEWVSHGGGMFVLLGDRSAKATWPQSGLQLIGTPPGVVVDRIGGRGATVSILNYDHPVFEPFSAPRSGDFSAARFLRYRHYEGSAEATVLARFDDGAIALAELAVGSGRVMVWTGGAAGRWSDFPLKPVFLPFIHQVTTYLAGYREEPAAYRVGEAVPLDRTGLAIVGDEAEEFVVESPTGARSVIVLESAGPLELQRHGFYEIRALEGKPGRGTVVAVNPDPVESDLAAVDPEEIALAVAAPAPAGTDDRTATLAAALTPGEKERRQALWWYLLLGAILVLLVETGVGHRATGAGR